MASEDKSASPIDPDVVRELAQILKESDLMEIEVRQDDLKLRLSRGGTVQAAPVAAPAPAPQVAPAAAPVQSAPAAEAAPAGDAAPADAVTSPMVGTVYLRPSPEADAFVKEGDTVSEGDTILLIEAMKTFNPITAPKSGKVGRLLVMDSQPVEFGEPLFTID